MWLDDEFEKEEDEEDEWDFDLLLQQKYGIMDIRSPGGPVAEIKYNRNATLGEKQVFEALAKAFLKLSPTEIIRRLNGQTTV
jgi:hypothetical protein